MTARCRAWSSACALIVGQSALGQRAVGLRAAVAVERPELADLVDHVEVELAHDELLVTVAGGPADDLAPGVDEVAGAVEVVVAVLLDADPVDSGDEVLVGHGCRRLLELPQVGRQPAAGGRRVVDKLGAGQAECPPTLREVAVIADVDADPADRRVENRPAPG